MRINMKHWNVDNKLVAASASWYAHFLHLLAIVGSRTSCYLVSSNLMLANFDYADLLKRKHTK